MFRSLLRLTMVFAVLASSIGCYHRSFATPIQPGGIGLGVQHEGAGGGVELALDGTYSAYGAGTGRLDVPVTDDLTVDISGTRLVTAYDQQAVSGSVGVRRFFDNEGGPQISLGGGFGGGAVENELLGGVYGVLGVAGRGRVARPLFDLTLQYTAAGPFESVWTNGRVGVDFGSGVVQFRPSVGVVGFGGSYGEIECFVWSCSSDTGSGFEVGMSVGLALRVGGRPVVASR